MNTGHSEKRSTQCAGFLTAHSWVPSSRLLRLILDNTVGPLSYLMLSCQWVGTLRLRNPLFPWLGVGRAKSLERVELRTRVNYPIPWHLIRELPTFQQLCWISELLLFLFKIKKETDDKKINKYVVTDLDRFCEGDRGASALVGLRNGLLSLGVAIFYSYNFYSSDYTSMQYSFHLHNLAFKLFK